MSRLYYDLHIHSCLSPCGDPDMTVNNIVNMSILTELDAVALTDHNSCKNCPAFFEAGRESGKVLIAGMELTTSEEIHVVCLFEKLEDAMRFDEYVYERLPDIDNEPEIFGEQVVLDCDDNEIGKVSKLLINATSISIEDLAELSKEFNFVAFPAHIDKQSFSILASLGYIPEEYGFTAFEVKDPNKVDQLKALHPALDSAVIVTDSDAHYLEHISEKQNFFEDCEASVSGIINRLKNR